MSRYTSYTAEDLTRIIEHTALELMLTPVVQAKRTDGAYLNLTEISHQNSMHSMYNDGIRTLAQTLIDQLTGEEKEE
ncbi:MAG: hypothetical protein IJQ88_03430 [Clostridia bacterium]|nr:hypothetical protein [Clostridia bacterium]